MTREPTIKMDSSFPFEHVADFGRCVMEWAVKMNIVLGGGVSVNFARLRSGDPAASFYWNGKELVWLFVCGSSNEFTYSRFRMSSAREGVRFNRKNVWEKVFKGEVLAILARQKEEMTQRILSVGNTTDVSFRDVRE